MSDDTDDDDAVGYGRPPRRTRFRPGRSGNPGGRPKGVTSLKRAIADELSSEIDVREEGRTIRVSKMQALVKRLVAKALSGDPRAMAELARQINLHQRDADPAADAELPASEEDARLLADFARRHLDRLTRGETEASDGDDG